MDPEAQPVTANVEASSTSAAVRAGRTRSIT
jgi:hypothetical protein